MKTLSIVSVSALITIVGALVLDLTGMRVTGAVVLILGIFGIIAGPLFTTLDD